MDPDSAPSSGSIRHQVPLHLLLILLFWSLWLLEALLTLRISCTALCAWAGLHSCLNGSSWFLAFQIQLNDSYSGKLSWMPKNQSQVPLYALYCTNHSVLRQLKVDVVLKVCLCSGILITPRGQRLCPSGCLTQRLGTTQMLSSCMMSECKMRTKPTDHGQIKRSWKPSTGASSSTRRELECGGVDWIPIV